MKNLSFLEFVSTYRSLKNLSDFVKTRSGSFIILITAFFIVLNYAFDSSNIIILAVGVLLFFCLYKTESEISSLKYHVESYNHKLKQLLVEGHNAMILSSRHPLASMPVSDYTMKPNNLMLLEATFLAKKPQLTLELGSGLSTQLLSSLVKKERNGRVISFDHDFEWVQLTQLYLKYNELYDSTEVIYVPLVKHDENAPDWYDYKPHQAKINGIDLLVIDGPPASHNELIREGAMKFLYEYLSNEAILFIDDAARDGEIKIIESWLSQYPQMKMQKYDTMTGVCIIFVQK